MKRLVFSALLLMYTLHLIALDASVNVYKWRSTNGPYVEAAIEINGASITHEEVAEGKLRCTVSVLMLLKQGDNIVDYKKYNLVSPDVLKPQDLVDVQRFVVLTGLYDLEVTITDLLNEKAIYKQTYQIDVLSESITDLVFMKPPVQDSGKLSRNGYRVEPLAYPMLADDETTLHFYTEYYDGQSDKSFVVYEVLDTAMTLQRASSAVYKKGKALEMREVEPMFGSFDLSDLPSGVYNLRVTILSSKQEIVGQIIRPFLNYNTKADISQVQDYNVYLQNSFVNDMDSATVDYSLQAIMPVVNPKLTATLEDIIENGSLESQKYFLHRYYFRKYKKGAEEAYHSYMKVAKVLDDNYYDGVGHGFLTDRGYIYLRYGRPNKTIMVDDEPNGVPYEIWYYAHMPETNQTDVRFIFYNPSLAHRDFRLLHSTCYQERNNPRWVADLYRKYSENELNGYNMIDSDDVKDNWGRRAKRLFNEF